MHGRLSSLAPGAICCLLIVSGCADTAYSIKKTVSRPFTKTPEQIYGIKTPKDRVKEFRKLADRADSLSPTEQEQQVAALAQEFKDESDGWVRREILRALSQFPQPAAGAVLVDALYDGDTETRRVACRGLGIRGDEIAVRELVRVVNTDTETEVRMSAVRALGKTGDKTALAPLAEALADGNPAMQATAHVALTEVSGHDYGNNLEAWREFAQNGTTEAPEISVAEKLRRALY